MRRRTLRAIGLLGITLCGLGPSALASSLPASEAGDFLGDWTLSMEFQGNPVEMTLQLGEESGNVTGSLLSPQTPEPQIIEDISREGNVLTLSWERDFGGQAMVLVMELTLADGELSGVFGDEGGFFSAELAGQPASAEAAEAASAALASAAEGDSQSDSGGRRRRRAGSRSTLTLEGHEINVAYAGLKTDSEDYEKLAKLEVGEVFTFVGGRATKLMIDSGLKFGETTVSSGNASPNYPGVYSVWLKKVPKGWHLVFNHDADIWGTQHLAESDSLEIPVDYAKSEEAEEKFKVDLIEAAGGGLLRLAWGEHQWMAPFQLAR